MMVSSLFTAPNNSGSLVCNINLAAWIASSDVFSIISRLSGQYHIYIYVTASPSLCDYINCLRQQDNKWMKGK